LQYLFALGGLQIRAALWTEADETSRRFHAKGRPLTMTSPIETALFELLGKVAPEKSIAPEDVAKAVDPEGWRRKLGEVRNTAIGLARQGRLVITRHGKPADPDSFKGVYRLKLPREGIAGVAEDEPVA
jgi:hypothetical protein